MGACMEIGCKCGCLGMETGHWQFSLCGLKYKLSFENECCLFTLNDS